MITPKPGDAKMKQWIFLDRLGWPVELFVGRPITNAIRLLLHARRIERRGDWIKRTGIPLK